MTLARGGWPLAVMVLPGAIRGHQAGFPHGSLAAGDAKAGSVQIGPSLLGTIPAGRMNIEAVGLGERVRDAGFDLRRKAGQEGEAGGDDGSNSNG